MVRGIIKKIGIGISKQVKKMQINNERSRELKLVKEKYLSQLSHKELVQIYKTYIER